MNLEQRLASLEVKNNNNLHAKKHTTGDIPPSACDAVTSHAQSDAIIIDPL